MLRFIDSNRVTSRLSTECNRRLISPVTRADAFRVMQKKSHPDIGQPLRNLYHARSGALRALLEAGFTGEEVIQIATLNVALYLGQQDRIGTIAPGKQADLILIKGDPSKRIDEIENVETVFKAGISYDSKRLIDSVRGQVGIRLPQPVRFWVCGRPTGRYPLRRRNSINKRHEEVCPEV